MKKSVLLSMLCFSLAFLTPPTAVAELVTLKDLIQREQSLSSQILEKIDTPEAQAKLAEVGISTEEAKMRVAGLSDQEIRNLLNSHTSQQAGGDIVIGLTTVLLIVIIVLLLR